MRIFIIIISFVALLLPYGSYSQMTLDEDVKKTSPRHFDEDAMERYSERAAYDYQPYQEYEKGFFTRGLESFSRFIGDFFEYLGPMAYILLIALVALVVYLFVKYSDGRGIAEEYEEMKEDISYELTEKDINEINFESALSEALKQKNYKRATRLLYLRILKKLADQGKIVWEENKTNHDYLKEIKNKQDQMKLFEATLLFEYVWYGDFPVDQEKYRIIEPKFNAFGSK